MIIRLVLGAFLLLAPVAAFAHAERPRVELTFMTPPTNAGEVPLYPAGSLPVARARERWSRLHVEVPDGTSIDARIARNVSVPTITPVLPDPAKASGAAVIVAPGGGYLSLSMDPEGFEVARWLADRGIAAFVLKYRLQPTPDDEAAFMTVFGQRMAAITRGETADVREPLAVADAVRAIELVREDATRWKVDPARIGMIGFSAGALTALRAVLAEKTAVQPAFIGYIYGDMSSVAVPRNAPPMFVALALDDKLYGQHGFGLVDAWRRAGRPVELHAFEHGDHGFGTGKRGTTSMLVMDEFLLWLETRGFLGGEAH